MYIANFEITKEMISVGLMILFFGMAMFFIGYKYAYDKAVNYANEKIEEKVNEFKTNYGIVEQSKNPDVFLGNIELPVGGQDE